jgi:Nucleotide-diphospho-sugar transferase
VRLDSNLDRANLNRCIEQLLWHESQAGAKKPLDDLNAVLDQTALFQLAEATHLGRTLTVSFLTKEYLSIGLTWIEAMKSIRLWNYIIIAGDRETSRTLKERDVSFIEALLDVAGADPSYLSPGGFTATGVAISAVKFPVVLSLLKGGFNVVLSDVDAIWFRNPMPVIGATADMAFQRVARFPNAIVRYWGFAACGGFVFFRASAGGVALAEGCLREHRIVQDDQLAMNLALLENDIRWKQPDIRLDASSSLETRDIGLEASFEAVARFPIEGKANLRPIAVEALAHHQFWRHDSVPFDPNEIIVCHPNSPKGETEKLNILMRRGVACVYAQKQRSA